MCYANRRHEDRAVDHVTLTDKNGETYLLRPIRPADAPSLMRGYDAMSDQAKWFRMLHTVPHLSEDVAQRYCAPDPERDLCFVIEGQGTLLGEILGGARIAGEDHGDCRIRGVPKARSSNSGARLRRAGSRPSRSVSEGLHACLGYNRGSKRNDGGPGSTTRLQFVAGSG